MTDISVIKPLRWSFWWRIYPSYGTQRVKLQSRQLAKRIHGESNEFDEEEALQTQRKDRRLLAPFYLESPIEFTFTWNRPLYAVLLLLEGRGGGGGYEHAKTFRFQLTSSRRASSEVAPCVADDEQVLPSAVIIKEPEKVNGRKRHWKNNVQKARSRKENNRERKRTNTDFEDEIRKRVLFLSLLLS